MGVAEKRKEGYATEQGTFEALKILLLKKVSTSLTESFVNFNLTLNRTTTLTTNPELLCTRESES